jgi:hypothetical protein
MYKIICTGNPAHEGIAKSLTSIYSDITFVSRSNGYDLNTHEGLEKLKNILPEFNVLINNSHVGYGVKRKVLEIARQVWTSGRVINIGSYSEIRKYSLGTFYSTQDATELRELGFELGDEEFHVTHFMVGPFKSTAKPMSTESMDPIHIANTIKWVLEAEFQVPIISAVQISDSVKNWHKELAIKYFDK